MKTHFFLISSIALLIFSCKDSDNSSNSDDIDDGTIESAITINPIEQATTVIEWGDKVIYLDPTKGAEAFAGFEAPDLVFITDIHGDHLDTDTLDGLQLDGIPIIVPQAVADELDEAYTEQLVIMVNNEITSIEGIEITAIPMYNIREDVTYHVEGRGNGYVLEYEDKRMYVAGDTEDTEEFRTVENIDIALVPMNLPYTMPVENAADGVLEMAPKTVYPFHYRNQDGSLSDVASFKELVNNGNPDIEVIQLDWYPDIE